MMKLCFIINKIMEFCWHNVCLLAISVRDRPFNLQGGCYSFFFVQKKKFRTTRELEYFFCCRTKREICFQCLTLGYMTKTLNQIIFFSSTKIRIFFQQHWESEYFFRKKTIAKLNGPSLRLSNISILIVLEGYSRNASCTLTLISTFL